MTAELPEADKRKDIAIAAGLGAVGSLPGIGGLAAGAMQGVLNAKQREIDENYWAHLAARIAVLEKERPDYVFDWNDPDVYPALQRLLRAAHETADEEKRRILAETLANAGTWSPLPEDRKNRALRALTELTSWELHVLGVLVRPNDYFYELNRDGRIGDVSSFGGISMPSFLQKLLTPALVQESGSLISHFADVLRHLQAVQLATQWEVSMGLSLSASGVLASRATSLGHDVVGLAGLSPTSFERFASVRTA